MFCRLHFASFFIQLIPLLPQVTREKQIYNKLLQGPCLRKVNRNSVRGVWGGNKKKKKAKIKNFILKTVIPSNLPSFPLQESSREVPPPRLSPVATEHSGWLVLLWPGFSKPCICVLSASRLVLPADTGTHTHISNASCQQPLSAITSQPQLPEPFQGSQNGPIDP